MSIILRSIEGEEMLETLYSLNSYAMHPSPPFQDKETWMADVTGRQGVTCHAAFEDEKAISIAASTSMTQNMRGKLFPASGIWGVSTDPSARRKGYCRQVMVSLLASEKASGKVFSNLYPFRESFYERLGYVAFPLTKIARFSVSNLSQLLKHELEGEIILQLIGPAFPAYREYLSEMRLQKQGMALFDFANQARANQNMLWVAKADFYGNTEGLMLYRTTGEEVTKYNFVASRFYYQTSRARYLLLSWMARHIDQADQVELWIPEDEYPETWLADLEVKVETFIRPAMCRVLDIENMNGMVVGEGSFSVHIIDPLCPWNEGKWSFSATGRTLLVSKVSTADCDLNIQGLSALVTGTCEPQDFRFHGWGEPSPEVQARMRKLFPGMRPYLHEMF